MSGLPQVPFRYETRAGFPPRIRTGYYYLPTGWRNTSLPVMVLFHGLAGYGISILDAGSQGTFQVTPPLPHVVRPPVLQRNAASVSHQLCFAQTAIRPMPCQKVVARLF